MKREDKAAHYCNMAALYTVLAIASGVFYREFTKLSGFTGYTKLSLAHTHYFALGTFFFLIVLALEKTVLLSIHKGMRRFELCYHIGLNGAVAVLLLRGIITVKGISLTSIADSAVSVAAGVFHIMLCAAFYLFFRAVGTGVKL